MTIPTVDPPSTRDEIVAALRRLHEESTAYWRGYPTEEFFAPIGRAWSPADNVRHLSKSIRAVTRGLEMPRIALFFLFGIARRPSRSYVEVREAYHGVLAAGCDAGRFAPSAREAPADLDAWRGELMDEREKVAEALVNAIGGWSEKALDRYRIPHPLLGKLTVREMLFFTLYHNLHHVHVVERRKAEVTAGQPA